MAPKFKPSTDIERKVFDIMRSHPRCTNKMLKETTGLSLHHIQSVKTRADAAGMVRRHPKQGKFQTFTCMTQDEERAFYRRVRRTDFGPIWTQMTVLNTFSPDELYQLAVVDNADLTLEKVQDYCRKLLTADYLQCVEKAISGMRPARYRLVQNTGPLPPKIQRLQCVVDGNDDRVRHVQGGRI